MVRIGDINPMKNGLCPFRRGGFGRPDVHPAVHLHGVGGDDLGSQSLREDDANGCLPDCRGSDEGDTLALQGIQHGSV